jgi:hypothetical protein
MEKILIWATCIFSVAFITLAIFVFCNPCGNRKKHIQPVAQSAAQGAIEINPIYDSMM